MKIFSIDYHLEDGAGAGVTINAVAFLIIQENNIKLMPVCHSSSLWFLRA